MKVSWRFIDRMHPESWDPTVQFYTTGARYIGECELAKKK